MREKAKMRKAKPNIMMKRRSMAKKNKKHKKHSKADDIATN